MKELPELPELPDGPATTGIELFQIFMSNPFPFLKECHEKYGDMFTIKLGDFGISHFNASGNWVFLCHPDLIKTLYKTNSSIILGGAANRIQFQEMLPNEGSVMMDGTQHIERRKLLSKLVQGKENIRQFTSAMCQVIHNEIKIFPKEKTFALAPHLRHISSEIMRHMTFGPIGSEDTTYIINELSRFGDPALTHDDKNNLVSGCKATVSKMMEEYKSCPHASETDEENVFNVLMSTHCKKKSLNEIDVQAELLVMLIGGSDTTGSTMSWILAWILTKPAIFNAVQEELQRVLTSPVPSAEDFDKLHYLDAVIHESCRCSPLLFNSSVRLLIEPLELGGYQLPAGTLVANCPYIIHNRADHYEEPSEFKPERFLNKTPDPYSMVFFGGGIRRCLGMAFALYEMKVVVAMLLHQNQFEPVDINTNAELQGSFFAPKGGVIVKLK